MPPWRSATIPAGTFGLLTAGVASEQSAAIRAPVFIGVGERDVVPDPRLEPSAYGSSRQIAMVVVERMAHMHNFASTRAEMWDRLHAWGSAIADAPVAKGT